MARRGQKLDLKGLLGFLLVAGGMGLIGKFFEGLPQGSGTVVVRAIYAAAALTIAYLIARFFARRIRARQVRSERARALQALLRKAQSVTKLSLVRRKAQLVQQDAYGHPKMENWAKELRYFVSKIEPSLTPDERFALVQNFTAIVSTIEDTVQAAMLNQPPFQLIFPFSRIIARRNSSGRCLRMN